MACRPHFTWHSLFSAFHVPHSTFTPPFKTFQPDVLHTKQNSYPVQPPLDSPCPSLSHVIPIVCTTVRRMLALLCGCRVKSMRKTLNGSRGFLARQLH